MAFTPEQCEKLAQMPPSENQSTRTGGGGRLLTYLKPPYVIETLNRIFGYGAWAYQVVKEPHLAQNGLTYLCIGQLFVEGLPAPIIEAGTDSLDPKRKDDPNEVDKAYKGSVTDAFKRCAARLGPVLGSNMAAAAEEGQTQQQAARQSSSQTQAARSTVGCQQCGTVIEEYTDSKGKVWTPEAHADRSKKASWTGGRVLCTDCFRAAYDAKTPAHA